MVRICSTKVDDERGWGHGGLGANSNSEKEKGRKIMQREKGRDDGWREKNVHTKKSEWDRMEQGKRGRNKIPQSQCPRHFICVLPIMSNVEGIGLLSHSSCCYSLVEHSKERTCLSCFATLDVLFWNSTLFISPTVAGRHTVISRSPARVVGGYTYFESSFLDNSS